jgi:hypothetical protein
MDIASKLELAGAGVASSPHELWERQPWFMHVLSSKWNSTDRTGYERNKQARSTHLDMLVSTCGRLLDWLTCCSLLPCPHGLSVSLNFICMPSG